MNRPKTNHPQQPAALIATLGTEPQVVTAAYDLLIAKGERIQSVQVLHTQAGSALIERAVAVLGGLSSAAFPIQLISLIDSHGFPLADVETPTAAESAFRALYRLVWQAKLSGFRVHLSIAGGRKSMAVFGMTVAQLLFDDGDHLWHLFSGGEFLASKRLHPEPQDDVHLMDVPVIRWGQVSPVVWPLAGVDDPYRAMQMVRSLQLIEKRDAAQSFFDSVLTEGERRVVELLVREGLGDAALGRRLGISARTVEQHLRSAYAKAAAHWQAEQITRPQLVALLAFYVGTRTG